MSDARGGPDGRQQGLGGAVAEVTERASALIREEIELAKAEVAEKTVRLAKGAVVAVVAGVFFMTALFFVLIGCAWLLYYVLPFGSAFTYFWGFFAMAVILVVLGVLAGLLAMRAVKAGSPPVPEMAIEEARKIRETVTAASADGHAGTSEPASTPPVPPPPSTASFTASPPIPPSAPSAPAAEPASGSASSAEPELTLAPPASQSFPQVEQSESDNDLGRGTV